MISREEILSLAELARLKLNEKEIESLQSDISNILEYVGQVSTFSADRSEEKPLLKNVLREDREREEEDPLRNKEEAVKSQFPRREGEYNVVRKIIQKDE